MSAFYIGYLEAWYVDANWRGQGMGRELVQMAQAWAREQGCQEIASDTDPSYPVSPAAHAALGYQEVERYFRKDLMNRWVICGRDAQQLPLMRAPYRKAPRDLIIFRNQVLDSEVEVRKGSQVHRGELFSASTPRTSGLLGS